MSDWDDLFRAAEGLNEEESSIPTTKKRNNNHAYSSNDDGDVGGYNYDEACIEQDSNTIDPSTSSYNHRMKKKMKCSEKLHVTDQLPLEKILNSRMDTIEKQIWKSLPLWLFPGSSLRTKKICQGWVHDTSTTNIDEKCQTCGWSMLHHSLRYPSTAKLFGQTSLILFVLVRNIRCCCSCILEQNHVQNNHDTIICIKEYSITALRAVKKLLRIDLQFLTKFHPGEAEILQQKLQNINKSIHSLYQKSKAIVKFSTVKNTFPLQGIFEELVQVMVDCDVAYFRIYYLQNADIMTLPIATYNSFIPHPVTYFGTVNLTWSVDKNCLTEFLIHVKSSFSSSPSQSSSDISAVEKMVNDDKPWSEIMTQLGVMEEDEQSDSMDPMSFLHKNRMMETICIFWKSGWMDSCESWRQLLQTIRRPCDQYDESGKLSEEAFYEKHQTPAPKVLQNWRDSCRDLLCNLYAYATLSKTSYREVASCLKNLNVSNILEMGAGTGYVARQIETMGLDVSAFDIAPTGGSQSGPCSEVLNEYHGSSPPFYKVQQLDCGRITSLLRNTRGEVEKTALLLCYPPPLSSMAEEALKSFIESGGEVVIHIGEFKGLTGSKIFETMISKQFRIEYRSQCLHWGTDAADVTVW
eukprot:CAMPEP_0176477860 /NCGR_PEP_ID=MMETSP0200_2-20121128/870_1 /TAXON_ID=947934 /ORGANISM="Chaetoceros sp., Strain GSL56" /LENGTH=634 /DNA_ID=CAMNT_0017873743 /DNA_START=15 /DNA_END=1916 /DNA_ORIENTATION=+